MNFFFSALCCRGAQHAEARVEAAKMLPDRCGLKTSSGGAHTSLVHVWWLGAKDVPNETYGEGFIMSGFGALGLSGLVPGMCFMHSPALPHLAPRRLLCAAQGQPSAAPRVGACLVSDRAHRKVTLIHRRLIGVSLTSSSAKRRPANGRRRQRSATDAATVKVALGV